MKICIYVLVALMTACTVSTTPDPTREAASMDAGGEVPSVDWSGYDHQTDPALGPGLCEKYERIVLKIDGNGFSITKKIPLPCDPLWKMKDRGDPPFGD